jgi:hypothetical protein
MTFKNIVRVGKTVASTKRGKMARASAAALSIRHQQTKKSPPVQCRFWRVPGANRALS